MHRVAAIANSLYQSVDGGKICKIFLVRFNKFNLRCVQHFNQPQ